MPFAHDKPPRYQSYVLRCWEMRSQCADRPATWRFSLEDVPNGQKHAFLDLKSLIAFLESQIDAGGGGECET